MTTPSTKLSDLLRSMFNTAELCARLAMRTVTRALLARLEAGVLLQGGGQV
jgi:hypothetical protein